jgi:molybdopterin-binding protein
VTHFRIAEAARLLGVSDDTVRRWTDGDALPVSIDASGRKVIAGADLAAFARAQAHSVPDPSGIGRSARNRFVGLVTRVQRDGVMAQVDLQAGPFRVVSLMSREAADDLGLEPGMLAAASVKATNVTIELPPGSDA